jgi:hypothetical protein
VSSDAERIATLMGHQAVTEIRMQALAQAIRERDWEQVEFQFDRVLGAVKKTHRVLQRTK